MYTSRQGGLLVLAGVGVGCGPHGNDDFLASLILALTPRHLYSAFTSSAESGGDERGWGRDVRAPGPAPAATQGRPARPEVSAPERLWARPRGPSCPCAPPGLRTGFPAGPAPGDYCTSWAEGLAMICARFLAAATGSEQHRWMKVGKRAEGRGRTGLGWRVLL